MAEHVAVREVLHGAHPVARPPAHARRGREADHVVARAVAGERPGSGQPHHGAPRHALQVAFRERRVGGYHHHDRPLRLVFVLVPPGLSGIAVTVPANLGAERVPAQLPPHRRAQNLQHAAEVRLHQHAHGIAAQRRRAAPASSYRCRPSSRTPTYPVPAPTAPSSTGPAAAPLQGHPHVPRADRPGADVIEAAIIGLGRRRG